MSNQLFDIIKSQLSDQVVEQLNVQIGNPNKNQMMLATDGIINTLIGALAKNASTKEGSSSLNNALERDHDGSLLDNLLGVFTGNTQANDRQVDGLGIIMHLLGNQTTGAVDMITKMSGLDRNKTARLLIMIAPIVLAALGKVKKQNSMDTNSIQNLLTDTVQTQHQNQGNPTMNLITKFLDKDNDGNVTEEIASIGMKMLGNLLKKR
jgi:hypothetical protein